MTASGSKLLGAAVLAVFAATPTIAAAEGPPAGWEVSPPRDKTVVKAIDRCGDSADCHLRQTLLDAPIASAPWTGFEVDFASLPAVRSLEAPRDATALRDVPPVRVIDGQGRPFPWPDGAHSEVRVMPPGKLGEIAWGEEWTVPFFEEPRYRSMGYGDTRSVDRAEDRPRSIDGPITYVSIDAAGADLVYDNVVGKLDGTPRIIATRWEHATAAPLPGGLGHAFRDDGAARSLVVLLPEVLLGIETSRTKVLGGFFPGSRFSTDQAFTRYTIPASVGATGTVMFSVLDTQRRRWLSGAKEKHPRMIGVVISSSQTSVEKAPRIVILARPEKSAF